MFTLEDLKTNAYDSRGKINYNKLSKFLNTKEKLDYIMYDLIPNNYPWIDPTSHERPIDTIRELLFCHNNNITEQPKCPICGNPVRFSISGNKYMEHCSMKCKHQFLKNKLSKPKYWDVEFPSENDSLEKWLEFIQKNMCRTMYGKLITDVKKTEKFLNSVVGFKESLQKVVNKYFPWFGEVSLKNIAELRYCLEHEPKERPVCVICGNPVNFKNGKYLTVCSNKSCQGKYSAMVKVQKNELLSKKEHYNSFPEITKDNKQEIIEFIRKHVSDGTNRISRQKVDKFLDWYQDEISLVKNIFVKWWNKTINASTISEFLYCLENNIIEQPKCIICNSPVEYNKNLKSYNKTCGNELCFKELFSQKEDQEDIIISETKLLQIAEQCKDAKGNFHGNKIIANILKKQNIFNPVKFYCSQKYPWIKFDGNDPQSFVELIYCIENNITERPKCPICGTKLMFRKYNLGYGKVCDNRNCQAQYSHQVGDRSKVGERLRETYSQKSQEYWDQISEKRRNTIKEKYGVEHQMHLESVRRKVGQKGSETKLRKREEYFKKYYADKFEILEDNISEKRLIKCKKCGNIFKKYLRDVPVCPVCEKNYVSKAEKEIIMFLSDIGVKNIESNKKFLHEKGTSKVYEVDILVPDLKLCIEFNGLFYHKTLSNNSDDKYTVSQDYHIKKSLIAREKGYHLIHIWEDWWYHKKDIVKNLLKTNVGKFSKIIYARNTEFIEITNQEARDFLEENHLEGYVGTKYRYALVDQNNEIVSVMTIKKKDDIIEISRYAIKSDYKIIGGFQKLLQNIEKILKPKLVVTQLYLELNNIPEESVYSRNGFKLITKPRDNFDVYPEETFYLYLSKDNSRRHRLTLARQNIWRICKELNYPQEVLDMIQDEKISQSQIADIIGGKIYTGYWLFQKTI